MTTDINTDIHPGATQVPPWVIRFARKETDAGEEWLVLGDMRPDRYGFRVMRGPGFCDMGHGIFALEWPDDGVAADWHGENEAEAQAAFEHIEEQWLRGEL